MAYNLERIIKEFNEACELANVVCDAPIRLNGRLTRTLGRVMLERDYETDIWNPTSIEFSKQLLETATDKSIRDVILHEAAHYIATIRTGENCGHNAYFKSVCAEIGTSNNTTTTKVERTVSAEAVYKYSIFCPTCNEIIGGKSRKCRTIDEIYLCYCKRCGNYGLKAIQNW